MLKPLVSICIPTYNGAKFLEEALESVFEQTYKNIEIVVSDDASSDDTLKIVNSFKEGSNIPFYIYNHKADGIGSNWNNCVKKSNGEYIKFLFQDDVLFPTCVERMVAIAITNKEVGLVYCLREIIFDTNKNDYSEWLNLYEYLHTGWDSLNLFEGIDSGKSYLKDKNLLDKPNNKIGEPPAVLLNKKCFEKVGYFNTQLSQTLDFEYWYRLMPHYYVGFVNEKLIKFRLHKNQASITNKRKKTKDKKLMPKMMIKNIFWYLHVKQKYYLLKEVCYIPELYKIYKRIKKRIIK